MAYCFLMWFAIFLLLVQLQRGLYFAVRTLLLWGTFLQSSLVLPPLDTP